MSLFGTIQIASNSLTASQVGLQVAGNNIANANTPGYLRQQVSLAPAPVMRLGTLPLGLGVEVQGIVQQVDHYLQDRMRTAASDMANSEAQEDVYLKLETLFGELNETDLSTALTGFFNSIHDILNQPENVGVRNLAVLKGETLAGDIRRLSDRARGIRKDVNDRIAGSAQDINRLLKQVANLNVEVVAIEAGTADKSDAVGLRDEREKALDELSRLMDIRTSEQSSGAVSIFAAGDILVFDGTYRSLNVSYSSNRALAVAELRVEGIDAPVPVSGGSLAGWMTARDQILGGFLDDLDGFARSLISEFNKVFASGQGLSGYQEMTSEFAVNDPTAALDAAGLVYPPVNGSFQIQMFNRSTGITETTDLTVRLNGLDADTTLKSLTASLDAVDGLHAEITPTRQLSLSTDSALLEFSFANDTSGILASLGLNTFFTGSQALDMRVQEAVADDPSKFAASRGGIGADTENAEILGGLLDTPLASLGDISLADHYEQLAADVMQSASVTRAVADGFRTFHQTLQAQQMAISGVSIDDEAIKILGYQRVYQASAKLIATVNGLLETLINL